MQKPILLCFLLAILQSCGSYYNQPVGPEKARLGETTSVTKRLKDFPLPQQPVVVGVYKFRDQTGQFKPTENGSTFSTAVTQGATTILVKALEDSKWFTPIERENLSNLLNERNIIRNTRKEYRKTKNPNEPQLPPLLYAGILLEGGIISYDSNIMTGGAGARYFGIGGSTQYRQDRISVYLRAVSTSSGKILKTVYVSKTILSQAVDASIFKYVKFKRLLEVETGFTKNEPVHLAVTEAIEKAVESLIIEGIEDRLWAPNVSVKQTQELLNAYKVEKEETDLTTLANRYLIERRGKHSFNAALGATYMNGDFPDPIFEFNSRVGYKYFLNPYLNVNTNYNKFNIANKGEMVFNEGYMSFDFNLEYNMLPYDKLTPFAYVGTGLNVSNHFLDIAAKVQFGIGMEYLLDDSFGIFAYVDNNYVFSDEVDRLVAGKQDDMYYRAGLGLNFYLGKPKTGHNKRVIAKRKKRAKKRKIREENKLKMEDIKKANRKKMREMKRANKEAIQRAKNNPQKTTE